MTPLPYSGSRRTASIRSGRAGGLTGELEASGMRAQGKSEFPTCKGKGRVPMHHGLRDKECPRCGGRDWIKARL
jgi:hypothetical protein